MKITVRYFASIREAIGHGSESVDTTAATLGALRDELIARGGAHASSLARGRVVAAGGVLEHGFGLGGPTLDAARDTLQQIEARLAASASPRRKAPRETPRERATRR